MEVEFDAYVGTGRPYCNHMNGNTLCDYGFGPETCPSIVALLYQVGKYDAPLTLISRMECHTG